MLPFSEIRRLLGMEFPLCVYMLTSSIKMPVFQNLVFEKVCLSRYDDMTLCTNVSAYYLDKHIQTDANHFYSYSNYCLTLPSIFATLLLGVASDYWSTKIPVLIPFVGLILGTTNYILQTVFMNTSVYLLLISDIIFGICGGYLAIISTTMSYGIKITQIQKRSYRIAFMEGAIGLGSTIGYAVSGTIRQVLGYSYVFVMLLVMQSICFFYIVIIGEELIDAEAFDGRFGRRVAESVQELWLLLRKNRISRTLIYLNLLALGSELFLFSGLGDIQYSYLRYKLAWDDKYYGWFTGVSYGITTLAVMVLYPLLRSRLMSDGQLGCLGMVTKIISLFVMAFLVSPIMAYSVAILTMLNRFVSSGFRAFLSHLVETQEQGKMFSLIALLEGVTALLASAVYNNVYPNTLSWFPGFLYVLSAVLLIPSIFILGWSDWIWRKQGRTEAPSTSISADSPIIDP